MDALWNAQPLRWKFFIWQLTKLEEWGYLTSEKMIEKKKTKSTYTITEFGLQQFEAYVSLLQSVLQK